MRTGAGSARGNAVRARRIWPCVILLLGPSVLLWPLFMGQCLFPEPYQTALAPWGSWEPGRGISWNALVCDAVLQYFPWRSFAASSLRAGEIPLWNPHQLCGLPFLANGQSAVLYPPNLIFWLLPVERAFGWSALLHLWAAGVFTFAAARRVLGLSATAGILAGIAYQLSGFLVAWTPMASALATMAWLPAGLVAADCACRRRDTAGLVLVAAVVATMLLAGHLQYAYYGVLLVLGYCIAQVFERWRGDGLSACLLGVLVALAGIAFGAALAAAQLLPTLELGQVNHRPPERSSAALAFLLKWSLDTTSAAALFTMAPYGNPSAGTWSYGVQNYAEICGVIGCVAVLLACVALGSGLDARRWYLVAVAVVSLAIAFGTPLAQAAYWLLPGFARFAGLPRVLCCWSLSVALLGGVGLDSLRRARESATCCKRAAACLALGTAMVSAVVAYGSWQSSRAHSAPASLDRELLVFCALLLVSALGIASCLRHKGEAMLVAVLALELLYAGHAYNLFAEPSSAYAAHPTISELRQRSVGGRVMCLTRRWDFAGPVEAALPPNGATVFGLRDVQGYDSLMPRWAKGGAARASQGRVSPEINGNMVMLGVGGLDKLDPALLAERGVAAVLAGVAAAAELEARGGFLRVGGSHSTAILAPATPPLPIPTHEGPNRMTSFDRPPESPGLVRETYDPAWRVRSADGRERRSRLDARTGFIRTDAEADEPLLLSYEPASFAVGGFLSLSVLAAMSSLLVFRYGPRPRGQRR